MTSAANYKVSTGLRQKAVLELPQNIPALAGSMSAEEALEYLIPQGCEDVMEASVGHKGEVILTFPNAENPFDNQVIIPSYIFNPERHQATFANFILQVSSLQEVRKGNLSIDYFDKYSYLVMNQNEILHTILLHRCAIFRTHGLKHYVGLVRKDIATLRTYCDFITPNTYNALLKSQYSYCVIDAFAPSSKLNRLQYRCTPGTNVELPMGELIRQSDRKISWDYMKFVLKHLKIHPESESMIEKNRKLVVYNWSDFYRGVGYKMLEENGNFIIRTIFPPKQNVPARLKTHLLTDGFRAVNNIEKPIFQQDTYLDDDGNPVVKDQCLLPAIVVFHDMDLHTGRFVFGEIEQTLDLAERQIVKREVMNVQFKDLVAYEGLSSTDGRLVIGNDKDDQLIAMQGFQEATVTAIVEDELTSSAKIVVDCQIEAGDARIVSASGLKGFTKTRPNLGFITMKDGIELHVDLVTGMNAVKGKQNTIVLARAALAAKLKYYNNNNEGYLDSLDPDEINEAASLVQKVKYTNEYGVVTEVWAGYVEYYVTEIGSMYSKFKPQAFMFEAGKYLQMQSDPKLFNFIWKDCLNQAKVDIAIELHKILKDDVAVYAPVDSLPVYTPKELLTVFSSEDLILSTQSRWDADSKLLDEEYNKGFYLDMRSQNAGIYRMPSAKLFNKFKTLMPNGKFIFPLILVTVSRILRACIVKRPGSNYYDIGFVCRKVMDPAEGDEQDQTTKVVKKKDLMTSYLQEAQAMLFSHEEKGMVIAQSFVKPEVMGLSMKQVPDHLVPWNVVVIYDDKNYQKILEDVTKSTFENKFLGSLTLIDNIIYGAAIRNPMLWCSQIAPVEIWDRVRFEKYLVSVGVDPKKHISAKHAKGGLLVSIYLTLIQHSDADGDLIPLFIPHGEGQEILKDFKLEGVTYGEAMWTHEYYFKEFEANQDLHDEPVYKLYDLPVKPDPNNKKTYSEYLLNSAIAKGTIGPATSNIWALYAILQMYRAYAEDADLYKKYIAPWRKRSAYAPKTITPAEIHEISYVYTRLVEEYVINAIKHMEGGSSNFEIYYLKKITEEANLDVVARQLTKEFGLSSKSCHVLMDVIQWSKKNGVMDAVQNFIRRYNKGSEAIGELSEQLEIDVARFTYFGSLVKPLFDITTVVNNAKKLDFNYGVTDESALSDFGLTWFRPLIDRVKQVFKFG